MTPILVCGSRTFDLGLIMPYVMGPTILPIIKDIMIIEGGADGADYRGRLMAQYYGWPYRTFEADWSLGKKAGPLRNERMAQFCMLYPTSHCFAFWDGKSRGTADMIGRAVDRGLVVHTHIYHDLELYHKGMLLRWQDKLKIACGKN